MKNIFPSMVFIAATVLTINRAACADLTETVATHISTTSIWGKANASLKDLRAAGLLSQSFSSTIYKSGDKIKTVNVGRVRTLISISDFASGTDLALDPTTKTEYVFHDQLLSTGGIPSAKIIDTKQTKMILGHKAHLFKFSLDGPGLTRTGDAWIAADITAPTQSESFVPVILEASNLSHQFTGMRGTWLEASVVTASPGSNTKISILYKVTALSSAPIPASIFAIPQDYTVIDYTKTQPAGNRGVVPQATH